MAIDQYLIMLCPIATAPVLKEEGWEVGWDYPEEFIFPINCSSIKNILNKYLAQQKSWSEKILIYDKEDIEATVFLKSKLSEGIKDIHFRISLLHHQSSGIASHQSLENITKIAHLLKSIADESGLKLFDTQRKHFMDTVEEIIISICNSRVGKLYGYDKYLSQLKRKGL